MGPRGNESGMDFEYENKTGPLDPQSPFSRIAQSNLQSRKRNYNAFDSPSRSPNKQPIAAFNSLYNTPRKPRPEVDDSSAGETPRSPEQVDSDATPDIAQTRSALTRFDFSSLPTTAGAERSKSSPTKEKERERQSPQRRESWLGRIKKSFSPGRGQIAKPDHSGAVEKSVKRRREREIHRRVARRRRHSMSESGDDSEAPQRKVSGGRHAAVETQQHWISSTFTFIAQHPTVPHILSFYAQLVFNVFLLAGCAYLIYCFWSAVQGDVDKKSHEAMADIMAEMAICAKSYAENRCDPSTRLPALETVCNNWYKCANQDPSKVGRAKVSAHTFAEIFNSFVEPISWKAMIFTFGLVFACFFTTNMAFGIFRDKTSNSGAQYQPYYQQPPAPTPQRSFSGQENIGYYGGATPWNQPPPNLEPQPSAGYGQIEGRGSPVRRLMYN